MRTLDEAAAWQLLDAVPDGLLVVDGGGLINYANRQFEVVTGYERDELIGRPVELLVPSSSREVHQARRAGYVEQPRVRMMGEADALELRRKDGSTVPVEISLAPVTLGGATMTAASVRDVSTQRAADRSRRQLLDLLDLVPDAVAVVNTETLLIEYVNQGTVELLCYDRDELIGMRAERIHPDVTDRQRRAEQGSLAAADVSGRRRVSSVLIRDRADRQIPCVVHVQVVPGPDGVARAINVLRDDRERREQEERLRISEESFRAAFEQAPIGMAVVRVERTGRRQILRANAALAALLAGTPEGTPEDLVGHDLAEFTHPADEPDGRAWAARLAIGQPPEHFRRTRLTRGDRSVLWADVRAGSIQLPDGIGTSVLVHLMDVTRQQEEERHRSQEAALTKRLAEVTTALLAGAPPEQTYTALAQAAAEVTGAENAAVVLPDRDSEEPARVAVAGPVATRLHSRGVPFSPELARAVLEGGATVAYASPPAGSHPQMARLLGPIAAAPVVLDSGRRGMVEVGRGAGAEPFGRTDLDLLSRLTTQVSLAITLAQARADQQRLALLEDRQRMARDLHDTVIQDLIAVGMQLNARIGQHPEHPWRAQDSELIDQLEEALRGLRTAVFALRAHSSGWAVSSFAEGLAAESARVLGHLPVITVKGPVDELPERIAQQVVLVLREALSNVARHARATATTVTLEAGPDAVRMRVDDNGQGIPSHFRPGKGIANMRHRAGALGGDATVSRRRGGGTRVEWSCPL